MNTYITEFARTWLKKISAFLRQLRQKSSFITPIRLETTPKKSEKEKEEREDRLIVSSTLEILNEKNPKSVKMVQFSVATFLQIQLDI